MHRKTYLLLSLFITSARCIQSLPFSWKKNTDRSMPGAPSATCNNTTQPSPVSTQTRRALSTIKPSTPKASLLTPSSQTNTENAVARQARLMDTTQEGSTLSQYALHGQSSSTALTPLDDQNEARHTDLPQISLVVPGQTSASTHKSNASPTTTIKIQAKTTKTDDNTAIPLALFSLTGAQTKSTPELHSQNKKQACASIQTRSALTTMDADVSPKLTRHTKKSPKRIEIDNHFPNTDRLASPSTISKKEKTLLVSSVPQRKKKIFSITI